MGVLARDGDPITSHMAAESLDTRLGEKHLRLRRWLDQYGPATDERMSYAVMDAGDAHRIDQARRVVRTAREAHNLMVPALDHHGVRIRHQNTTGRWADCWV